MQPFYLPVQIRWSDLDPNFHLRHSVYYDWGALCRIEFLNNHGLTAEVMQGLGFGPILFREECVFRREVRSGDAVRINLEVIRARRDHSRWSIRHRILKGADTLCAQLTVEGAWMNVAVRKLATPPETIFHVFEQMPRAEEFEWTT